MENSIHSTWKSKSSFPTSCKQSCPQFHKVASYTHSHNADYYGIPLILSFFKKMKNTKIIFILYGYFVKIFIYFTNQTEDFFL